MSDDGEVAILKKILLFTIFAAAAAFGHHSFAAEYDGQALVTLKGVITKVEWTNPHAYFYIDVKDAATGAVANWAIEGYPPNTLKRTGFVRDDLKVGETITITAWRARDGSLRGAGREVTFSDTSKTSGDASKKYWGPAAQ